MKMPYSMDMNKDPDRIHQIHHMSGCPWQPENTFKSIHLGYHASLADALKYAKLGPNSGTKPSLCPNCCLIEAAESDPKGQDGQPT